MRMQSTPPNFNGRIDINNLRTSKQISKEIKVKGLEERKCYIIFKQHERIHRQILDVNSDFSNVSINKNNS